MGSSILRMTLVILLTSICMIGASLPAILSSGPISNDTSPPPDEMEQLSNHVLLIVLDGVPQSVFDDEDMMPFVAAFDSYGVKLPVETSELTLTGACVKELATGREATPMDAIRNWEVTNEVKNDPFYHTALRGDSVAFSGFYVWKNLYPDTMFTHNTSADYGFEDISEADDEALNVVNGWLASNEHTLMVSHLGGTDHAAHIHGLDSPVYKERMQSLDKQLEDVFTHAPEDWTVILTSDHGVTNYGGHALGTGAAAEEVYLFAHGKGIAPATTVASPIQQRDISMLLSALLKLPLPVPSDARIPLDALDLTIEEREMYEQWNWDNVRLHQELRQNTDGDGIQNLPEEPNWSLVDIDQTSLPILAMIVTVLGCGFLFFFFREHIQIDGININSSRSQGVAIGLFTIAFFSIVFLGRESEQIISGRWLRKLLGMLPIVALTLYFMLSKRLKFQNSISLFLLTCGIILLFYPELRYSMIPIALAPFGLYMMYRNEGNSFTMKERFGLGILFALLSYQILDYLPRFFTGVSLQALLNVDLLYKPMQRIVMSSLPSEPLTAAIIVLLGCFILIDKEEKSTTSVAIQSSVVLGIFALSIAEFMPADWILICVIISCALYAFISNSSESFQNFCGFTPVEIILLAWVGPTWGFFPAFTTIFLSRVAPKLFTFSLSWYEGKHQGRTTHPLFIQTTKCLIAVSLLYSVWFNFSLLTPLGILEFNPSKVIVTGGFFGSRTDPSIPWMGLMILGPPLLSLNVIFYRISSFVHLDAVLLFISILLLSHASAYWTSSMFTEYFVMLSTASIFYITLLIIGCMTHGLLRLESRKAITNEQ